MARTTLGRSKAGDVVTLAEAVNNGWQGGYKTIASIGDTATVTGNKELFNRGRSSVEVEVNGATVWLPGATKVTR